MLSKALISSNRLDWETPQSLYDELDNEFSFTLDACADENNYKHSNYYSPECDGLSKSWSGTVFCNPPYGKEISKWVKKAYQETRSGDCIVVMLIPARTDTSYWHDYIFPTAEVRFLRGRIKFMLDGKTLDAAPFPSVVVVFGGKNK